MFYLEMSTAKQKRMDKKRNNLKKKEKRESKLAKRTAKSMNCNNSNYMDIVEGWNVTDSMSSSQTSAYEKGQIMNKKGSKFCRQEATKKYREGFRNSTFLD